METISGCLWDIGNVGIFVGVYGVKGVGEKCVFRVDGMLYVEWIT